MSRQRRVRASVTRWYSAGARTGFNPFFTIPRRLPRVSNTAMQSRRSMRIPRSGSEVATPSHAGRSRLISVAPSA